MFKFKRDIIGNKRLFYTKKPFLFNESSIETIILDNSLSPKVNLNAIKEFISTASINPNETFYSGIYRVPPGYELLYDGQEIRVSRWWKPWNFKIDYSTSYDEFLERFRVLFEKSVESCIGTSAVIGCELSGGFDSSSVFCIASKRKNIDIITLTMKFSDSNADEISFAKDAYLHCKSNRAKHIFIDSDNLDYSNTYDMKYNYALTPHWPIWVTFTMKIPKLDVILNNKLQTVLTGQMGDHLLYGSSTSINNYFYRGKYLSFIKELFYVQKPKKHIKTVLSQSMNPKLKYFLKKILKKKITKFDNKQNNNDVDLNSYKSIEVNKQMIQLLTSNHFLMYLDNTFMSAVKDKYNINFCSPFANQELIEFMLTVPPEYIYSMQNHRSFHSEAMKHVLPNSILKRRKKAIFNNIIKQQIDSINRNKLWENATIISMGLFTKDELYKLENKYVDNTISARERNIYWRMINIEYWYALNPYLDKSQYPPNPYILDSL
jgi:asparagine synthase (glutamine-hydrolysing)